ncbi:MAG: helix-turn-helix domain-containing protein [Eggerthellaceae bacterium]|nr:helix-turn-helix domain-containing protein [Eggerthellaceae bacterium]
MSIAEVLEERRVARGVSYAEIARRCSMNPDVVSRAFQGKGELKAGQFLNICRVLGLNSSNFEMCETGT